MKKLIFLLILGASLCLNSCMTHRHTVGDGPVGKIGRIDTYSTTKQMYLFWGLMPLGHSQGAIPTHGNYQIKTSHNIVDAFLTGITGGIFSVRTVKVYVKKGDR